MRVPHRETTQSRRDATWWVNPTRSFGPQVDGVANVGPLLNEATTRSGEVTNCARTATTLMGYQAIIVALVPLYYTRDVGQGLMWDYALWRKLRPLILPVTRTVLLLRAPFFYVHPSSTCTNEGNFRSGGLGLLSIDMEHMCVHWGFSVGLALVYMKAILSRAGVEGGAAKQLMRKKGRGIITLRRWVTTQEHGPKPLQCGQRSRHERPVRGCHYPHQHWLEKR